MNPAKWLDRIASAFGMILGFGDDDITTMSGAEKAYKTWGKTQLNISPFVEAQYEAHKYDLGEIPTFPPVPGTLEEFCNALSSDLPREWKLMSAITYVGLALSGEAKLEIQKNLQPRFFTVLIGDIGRGKTWTMAEMELFFKTPLGFNVLESMNSGPALVDTFFQLQGATPTKLMLSMDEFTSLVTQMKNTRDSKDTLSELVRSLYEKNSCANVTKKDKAIEVKNAHLAIIGGVPRKQWETLWIGTNASQDGLQSRLCLAVTEPGRLGPSREDTNFVQAERIAVTIGKQVQNAKGTVIKITPDALDFFSMWWEEITLDEHNAEFISRLDDMVKRFLIVLAVTNNTTSIDVELMKSGLQFGDYQLQQRKLYATPDAMDRVQMMEQKIVSYLKENPKSYRRDLYRHISAQRYGATEIFNRAIDGLKTAGVVSVEYTDRGFPLYSLAC
jgi:hypothetical protein